MKSITLLSLAVLALASCVMEETISAPEKVAIQFDNAFIDNLPLKTKTADPTIATSTITAFNVWSFMDSPQGLLLEAEDVTKENDKWTYENIQYWAPDHTYYFAAVAPMDSQDWSLDLATANTYGPGILTFDNQEGTVDLLYTATSVKTPEKLETLLAEPMDPVDLTFNHLLSKVKFTFRNGFETDNVKIIVKDIEMKAPKSGTINLAVENWMDNDDWVRGEDVTTLCFGSVAELTAGQCGTCTYQRMTIPAASAQEYEITFTVAMHVGNNPAMEVRKTTVLSGTAFNMGRAYNLNTTITPENLGLQPIEFTVSVKEWLEEEIIQ